MRVVKRIRIYHLLLAVAITFQVVWYLLLLSYYLRTPGELEHSDFLMFYAVGKVAREYGLEHVYDIDLERAAQSQIMGVILAEQQGFPPNHPPFLNPLMKALAGLDFHQAYLIYLLFLLGLAAAGMPVLYRTLRMRGWSQSQVWVVLGGVILFEPFMISVLKGQDTAILLLGGLLWFSGLAREDERLAGLGVSLTLIRPQIALVLSLPFLFRRSRTFWWFCVGGLLLGVYSFAQVGWIGLNNWLKNLALSATSQGYGMYPNAMFNLVGLLLRLTPDLGFGLVRSLGEGFYAAALVGLCGLWWFSKSVRMWHISLAVCVSLFFAPHLHYHDLTLLAIPLLGLGLASVAGHRLTVTCAASLLMAVSVVLLVSEYWGPAIWTVPYVLMAVLPLLTWLVERNYAHD